ncbi:disulfide bond formation protein B [Algirhabdus cladophorae]|uniref:disulfide bond formation protein B n=1 Tax=Algirhabdus cladophorae TaxID=3377108 RepID=UPI003B84789F
MDARTLGLFAAGGSLLLIAGAWMFEFMGYPPCKMCHWQRWPHYIAIVLGVLIFLRPKEIYYLLGSTAAFVTSAVGVFHTGVEKGWWEGPSSCTGSGALSGLSGADLLSTDGDFLVMCDQVSWAFLGVSMASWNAIFSAGLVLIWIAAAKRA